MDQELEQPTQDEAVGTTEEQVSQDQPTGTLTQLQMKKRIEVRKKLVERVERLRSFCSAKKVQAIVFGEGTVPGTVSMGGYYSEALIRALVLHIAKHHGDTLELTLNELNAYAEQRQKEAEELQAKVEGDTRVGEMEVVRDETPAANEDPE